MCVKEDRTANKTISIDDINLPVTAEWSHVSLWEEVLDSRDESFAQKAESKED